MSYPTLVVVVMGGAEYLHEHAYVRTEGEWLHVMVHGESGVVAVYPSHRVVRAYFR